jgi:hypothetical protein
LTGRMRLQRFALLILTALIPMTASAQDSRVRDGQYFCVVTHAAGLQYKDEAKNRPMFSGKIVLPDDDMKFFIRHAPMTYSDVAKEVCKHDIDYWFGQVLQKNLPFKDHAPAEANADDREWIGHNCFASDVITLTSLSGKLSSEFRGFGSYQYIGASTSTWFNFFNTGDFEMGFGYDSGPVIQYGHCTKIVPPK